MKRSAVSRRALRIALASLVLPIFGGNSPAFAQPVQPSEPAHAPRRALVGAADGEKSRAENSIRSNSGRITDFNEAGDYFVVETPSRAPDWIRAVRGRPGVRFAELDYEVRLNAVPNDPKWADMWGLRKIGMPDAWDSATGSRDVVVGIVDSGIDYNHEDLRSQMWSNPSETQNGIDDDRNGFVDDIYGADCANNDGDPLDDNNHGTHVAGTVGASTNNLKGVSGINWNVKLMALKFLGASGSGYTSAAVKCLDYAISKGADLTNNSWGGGGYSQALVDAISRTRSADQLFVAAAGNSNVDSDQTPSYPAAYSHDNIVSVAATDSNDAKASFSNYGKTSVDLAAPGTSIVSTVRNNAYAAFQGTSMASPHVAGTAALLVAKAGARPPYRSLIDALYASADPVPALEGQIATGRRLNAARAVQSFSASPLSVSILAASPIAFSPNSDGTADTTSIAFELNRPATWSAQVKDGAGMLLCETPPSSLTYGLQSWMWSAGIGTGCVAGPVAADGVYALEIKASDAETNTASSVALIIDSSKPVLSGINVASIKAASATISWTTNEPSDSLVRYRKSGSTTYVSASAPAPTLSHGIDVTGLAAGTTYAYQVSSQDAAGNRSWSEERSFTTDRVLVAYASGAVVQEASTVRSGRFDYMKADDGYYYAVNSTTSGPRISSWYATLKSIPADADNLKITYKGKNSKSCTQTLSVWRFSDSAWVQLDSRSVSTTEKLVTATLASGPSYVNSSAGGEMRFRVRCSGSAYSFYASADLMKINFEAP